METIQTQRAGPATTKRVTGNRKITKHHQTAAMLAAHFQQAPGGSLTPAPGVTLNFEVPGGSPSLAISIDALFLDDDPDHDDAITDVCIAPSDVDEMPTLTAGLAWVSHQRHAGVRDAQGSGCRYPLLNAGRRLRQPTFPMPV